MDAQARDAARPLTHAETRLIIIGTMLPVFLGSVDQTILASALPAIGRDLGNVHALPWLITAYLIAMTASTPLYGKISDIYGRRGTIRVAIAIYMLGSLICALAPTMLVLVLGRVIQGLGGGGLTSLGMVVLGDVAAPKERAKYYIYLSITFTLSGSGGPALGGLISDYLHWSAIFWLNLPLGVIAFVVTSVLLRRLPRHDRRHRLDLLGALLIIVSSVAFMLGLNLGGVRYPWTSLPVLGLGAVALVVGVLFVRRLLTAPEPLIPLSILRDPVACAAIAANGFGWAPIVGLNIFLPMYLQTVLGFSATTSGLSLMVLMGTLNLSAGVSSPIISHVKHYKVIPAIGLAISIAAVLILAHWVDTMTFWSFEVLLFVLGIGFGLMPPVASVMLQNTVSVHQMGIAIGSLSFTRNLLSTLVVAVFGAIILAGVGPQAAGPAAPEGLAPLVGSAAGFAGVFYVAAGSLAISLVALLLAKQKPLQTGLANDAG